MTVALLNWLGVMCRSAVIPASLAVPTLIRSRKDIVKSSL